MEEDDTGAVDQKRKWKHMMLFFVEDREGVRAVVVLPEEESA